MSTSTSPSTRWKAAAKAALRRFRQKDKWAEKLNFWADKLISRKPPPDDTDKHPVDVASNPPLNEGARIQYAMEPRRNCGKKSKTCALPCRAERLGGTAALGST
jgi:hypothetical protein